MYRLNGGCERRSRDYAGAELIRTTLERWIPIILEAQMPDGYLQTAYTLADRESWPERWSPDHRGNHEGYVSGYLSVGDQSLHSY